MGSYGIHLIAFSPEIFAIPVLDMNFKDSTSWALNLSESLKFPAIEYHAFTQNLRGFDHYHYQKWKGQVSW